jgi:hypothetical protein
MANVDIIDFTVRLYVGVYMIEIDRLSELR